MDEAFPMWSGPVPAFFKDEQRHRPSTFRACRRVRGNFFRPGISPEANIIGRFVAAICEPVHTLVGVFGLRVHGADTRISAPSLRLPQFQSGAAGLARPLLANKDSMQ